MITQPMVLAAARAIYDTTTTSETIPWGLLPRPAQHSLQEMALSALTAAESARTADLN